MRARLSKRIKWILGGSFALVVLALVFGPSRPRLILLMGDFQEWGGQDVADIKGRRLRDALIACGPSAIAPTIDTIRRHSAWTKRYLYLPDALRGLEHFK